MQSKQKKGNNKDKEETENNKVHIKINETKNWISGKTINQIDKSLTRLRKREDKNYKYEGGKKGHHYRCYRH